MRNWINLAKQTLLKLSVAIPFPSKDSNLANFSFNAFAFATKAGDSPGFILAR
jgi:hypothetical protein